MCSAGGLAQSLGLRFYFRLQIHTKRLGNEFLVSFRKTQGLAPSTGSVQSLHGTDYNARVVRIHLR